MYIQSIWQFCNKSTAVRRWRIIGRPTGGEWDRLRRQLPVRQGTVGMPGPEAKRLMWFVNELRLERAGYRPATSENYLLAEHYWPGSRISHRAQLSAGSRSGDGTQFCFAGRLCLAWIVGRPDQSMS